MTTATEAVPGFTVHLANFEGPFDLLLQLIGRHRLDITEVALSVVTDEFLAYVKAGQAAGGSFKRHGMGSMREGEEAAGRGTATPPPGRGRGMRAPRPAGG